MKTLIGLTAVILLFAACASYRKAQNERWNKQYDWINWPTNYEHN